MEKLHYTEKFYSVQGEGLHVGAPSVFLRMFGCNFRCRNFGRYEQDILGHKEVNPHVIQIIKNINQYTKFEDLPLAATGCDSYSSVYPEFKRYVQKETPAELARSIVELLPSKQWNGEHLVITGGEPLLGWQKIYPELLSTPEMQSLKEITFETNGTQALHPEFKEFLLNSGKTITFSVSTKLSCSGETREDAIKPHVVTEYQTVGTTFLKLVVATEADAAEAIATMNIYKNAGFNGHTYLMPVGGTVDGYLLTSAKVAQYALAHSVKYSPRAHIDLFGNQWGT